MKKLQWSSSSRSQKDKLAYVASVVMQTTFAGMFLLSKMSFSSGMKPPIFVAYRQAFATLALAPFAFFFFPSKGPPLPWRAHATLFLLSSGLVLCFNLSFAGLKCTSATLSSAIANVAPVLVFIVAVSLRMEGLAITQRHGVAKVAGSVISLSGAMAFTFYKGPPLYSSSSSSQYSSSSSSDATNKLSTNKAHTQGDWIKGSFLSVAAQCIWSLWLISQGKLLKQYPGKLRLTALQCGFSCIVAIIYGAAVERNISSWKLGWDIGLLTVAYCGVVVTGISYWIQAWVIENKGAVFSAIFTPLALVVSAIFSAAFLQETLHWGSVIGGVVIVGGLYCFLWGKNMEHRIDPDPSIKAASPLPIQDQDQSKTSNESINL